MASFWTETRTTAAGDMRYVVRGEDPGWIVPRRDGTLPSPRRHLGSFHTAKEADLRIEWAKAENAAGRVPDPTAIALAGGEPSHEDMRRWLSQRRDITAATIANYEKWCGRFCDRFPKPLSKVTVDNVSTWIGELDEMDFAPSTIQLARACVAAMFSDLQIQPNPVKSKLTRGPANLDGPRVRLPGKAQVAAMRGGMLPHHLRLFDFLFDTGARISEALALDWAAVHEDVIHLPNGKWRPGKPRTRAIRPDLHPIRLLDEARGTGKVFRQANTSFESYLRLRSINLGFGPMSPHDLRHLHATLLVNQHHWKRTGEIADRMGHSKTMLLETYADARQPE